LLDDYLSGVLFLACALPIRRVGAALLIMAVPLLAAKAVLLIVVGMTLFLICCPLWGDLRA
jgi:hypothetical protein